MNFIEKTIEDFFTFISRYLKTIYKLCTHPEVVIKSIENGADDHLYITPRVFLVTSILIINSLYFPLIMGIGLEEIDWNQQLIALTQRFSNASILSIIQDTVIVFLTVHLSSYVIIRLIWTPKEWRKKLLAISYYQYCLMPLIYSIISVVIPPTLLTNLLGIMIGSALSGENSDDSTSYILVALVLILVLVPIYFGWLKPLFEYTRKYFKYSFSVWVRVLVIFLMSFLSVGFHRKILETSDLFFRVDRFPRQLKKMDITRLEFVGGNYYLTPYLVQNKIYRDSIIQLNLDGTILNRGDTTCLIFKETRILVHFNITNVSHEDSIAVEFYRKNKTIELAVNFINQPKQESFVLLKPETKLDVSAIGEIIVPKTLRKRVKECPLIYDIKISYRYQVLDQYQNVPRTETEFNNSFVYLSHTVDN